MLFDLVNNYKAVLCFIGMPFDLIVGRNDSDKKAFERALFERKRPLGEKLS